MTTPQAPTGTTDGHVDHNVAAVQAFYARSEHQRSAPQRHAESLSGFVGRPAFLIAILLFVALWILANLYGPSPFDPAPFFWLQGLLGIAALLTTMIVLIKQNRVDKLAEQRAQLDLKMLLLIEQKTAKLIELIEDLRRDSPNVKDRRDASAMVMKTPLNPAGVLAALHDNPVAQNGATDQKHLP